MDNFQPFHKPKVKIKNEVVPMNLTLNKRIKKKDSHVDPNKWNKKTVGTEIPIISEETVDLKKENNLKTFWLLDPIDGTKEYIAGKDEYTINAALVLNCVPTIGLLGAPKKNRLFYAYGKNNSYMIEAGETTKLEDLHLKEEKE